MNIGQVLIVAAVLVWIVVKQFRGQYVSMRRMAVLPAILLVLGVYSLVEAHPAVTATAVALLVGELVMTVVLGVARGTAVRLSVRDGYLYQRGGVPNLLLWVLSIGVRIGVEVYATHVGAGALVSASIALSFGISLGVQGLVLRRRVLADGRPVRRDDRAGAARTDDAGRATLRR